MNAAIDIFKEFTPDKYNQLLPTKTNSQISPLNKIAINEVKISTNADDKEVYRLNGECGLTKRSLLRFAAAANIQILEIKKIPPSSCEKCLEMARARRRSSDCRTCPNKSDVSVEVIISIPDPAGSSRIFRASKEFICEDEKEKMRKAPSPGKEPDAQYKQAFPLRGAMTESKALTRALRAALAVKSTYTNEELKKPFAVPVIVPDTTGPEMKAALIRRSEAGSSALYGGQPQQQAISAGYSEIISVDVDDDESDDI